jgi:outer membrane protein TolC
VRKLTVDEAVALALEQNLGLRAERFAPQIEDLGVAQARAAFTPNLFSTLTSSSDESPPSSFLAGAAPTISDDRFSTTAGVQQQLPWGGGRYQVTWSGGRTETTRFTSFNPLLSSSLNAEFTQPLLRNFTIDPSRHQVLVSRTRREIADVRLREAVTSTTRAVRHAYWDLVFAIAQHRVQVQSLELAREQLRNNRTRVEVGTMAPIDIVEAEAEVARNEEAVIVAEAAIRAAEDRLRALVFDPAAPEFWRMRIEPVDEPKLQPTPVDVEAAVRNALASRTDLLAARKELETAALDVRLFENQRLPDVNLQATYGLVGLGGTEFRFGQGTFPPPVIGQAQRSFGRVLRDIFGNQFPSWSLGLTIGYPLGRSTAEAGLARARLQQTQTRTRLQNLELQVATAVRDVGRQVETNLKRVHATQAARQLAERRLEAEQKKFAVGMSTSFFIFQAQRELALARTNELRAIIDYNRSLVDFEAIQQIPLAGR